MYCRRLQRRGRRQRLRLPPRWRPRARRPYNRRMRAETAMHKAVRGIAAGAAGLLLAGAAWAQQQPAGALPLVIGSGPGGTSYSVPIQTLLFFTALSFLPAVLLMMTGFTRIVIVLSLLRQALGT